MNIVNFSEGERMFEAFPSIPRLSKTMIVTEKIDGTNAQITVTGSAVIAGSRRRFISPEDDNFGFALWVKENEGELKEFLGPGTHYGEWWGSSIQRRYGKSGGDKVFSLFNVKRWSEKITELGNMFPSLQVVPLLYEGPFDTAVAEAQLTLLGATGSRAAPGFMKPEGIVIYHVAANQLFKKTFEDGHKNG